MPEGKSFFDIIKWKLVTSTVVGIALWFTAGFFEFPLVFKIEFVCYAVLGFLLFVLLDLPPMPEVSGGKAIASIVVFYLPCAGVYTAGGTFLPQFDPAWEMGKIQKITDAKLRANPEVTPNELSAQADEVRDLAGEIMARLSSLEETMTGQSQEFDTEAPRRRPTADPDGDPVAYGKDVYEIYECYNCHKLGGKGGVKKRGPKMDNLGNITTAEDLKKKIFYPKTFMAEGFEKAFKKKTMPDKYKELMTDGELDALVIYLMTLKNDKVETPKMIPQ